ncbi:MAG TPA: molybdopterin cofactor-binding domain-containing protein [Burkholderiaceae bacterium]|nr:molybdopterin cofactor-binding domain-containing protein [Burkholderiaceae bacterium]
MTPPATEPRGFRVERGDGALPGSLHTNPRLAQWLAFDSPGVVQVFTGKAELGQGILTALQLLVAEELDVPLAAVRVHSASTARGPDEGMTSGSLSIQDSGGALRQACAEVRALATRMAAERSGIAAERIDVRDGRFGADRTHDVGDYWSLLAGIDLDVPCSGTALPKPPAARRLLGQARPERVDLPDKVFGRARFIHDLRLPGMLHGRVLRGPTLGAKLLNWPPAKLATLREGVRCWADGRFVAVVAPREREADWLADRLRKQLAWRPADPLPDANALPEWLRTAPHDTTFAAQRGDAAWPAEGPQFEAEFFKPYLAHASIGTSCAIARWDGGQLEVWTHSQGIHHLRDDLVRALAHEPRPLNQGAIVIHHVEGAGCYGHNGADDVAFDAVLMALRCPGHPVRVLWSRADELTHSPFGAAQLVARKACVDASGRLTHWQHELWANGSSSRPGRAKVPALLAASERAQASALPLAINPPSASGGGADRNAVPAYAVPNLQVINHRLTTMPLRASALRSLGAFANVFAIESFVDEIARSLGVDPLDFRKRHLDDARAHAVLDAVVERSAWWRGAKGEGLGHGLAWAHYKNAGAWCAAIARVQVGAQVRVLNLDLAVDVGTVIDLDGVVNQIEGGAIQSTSWTLKEQVTFERDRITSTGWDSYPVLRFGEVPEVRVHVIDRPDQPSRGAGEAAQGPVAAAIANAVHDALGVRVRCLPLSADNIQRAIDAADAA